MAKTLLSAGVFVYQSQFPLLLSISPSSSVRIAINLKDNSNNSPALRHLLNCSNKNVPRQWQHSYLLTSGGNSFLAITSTVPLHALNALVTPPSNTLLILPASPLYPTCYMIAPYGSGDWQWTLRYLIYLWRICWLDLSNATSTNLFTSTLLYLMVNTWPPSSTSIAIYSTNLSTYHSIYYLLLCCIYCCLYGFYCWLYPPPTPCVGPSNTSSVLRVLNMLLHLPLRILLLHCWLIYYCSM